MPWRRPTWRDSSAASRYIAVPPPEARSPTARRATARRRRRERARRHHHGRPAATESTCRIDGDILRRGAATGRGRRRLFIAKRDATALLAIDYPYQHGHEGAIYEVEAETAPQPTPPVGYRPARATLCLRDRRATTRSIFSTEGVLAAMTRLRPVLHRLADDDTRLVDGLPADPTAAGTKARPPPRSMAVPATVRGRPDYSEPPGHHETAIEAPYRLVISPNRDRRAGSTRRTPVAGSVTTPVTSSSGTAGSTPRAARAARVPPSAEPRTGRSCAPSGPATATLLDPPTGSDHAPGTLRAGARRGPAVPRLAEPARPPHARAPDLGDVAGQDRGRSARVPGAARTSSGSPALGAWLELHGAWNSTPVLRGGVRLDPGVGPRRADRAATSTCASMYPGFLYPDRPPDRPREDHRAQDEGESPSLAALYQRKFLVVDEPIREYPLPSTTASRSRGSASARSSHRTSTIPAGEDTFFWPSINRIDFRFTLDAVDRDGQRRHLQHAAALGRRGTTPTRPRRLDSGAGVRRQHPPHHRPARADRLVHAENGRRATRATADQPHPTARSCGERRHDAVPELGRRHRSTPCSGSPAPARTRIAYYPKYVAEGPNDGEVWAAVLNGSTAIPALVPGTGAAPTTSSAAARHGVRQGPVHSSDRAGGFVTPSLAVGGLSTSSGPVSDLAEGRAASTSTPPDSSPA